MFFINHVLKYKYSPGHLKVEHQSTRKFFYAEPFDRNWSAWWTECSSDQAIPCGGQSVPLRSSISLVMIL